MKVAKSSILNVAGTTNNGFVGKTILPPEFIKNRFTCGKIVHEWSVGRLANCIKVFAALVGNSFPAHGKAAKSITPPPSGFTAALSVGVTSKFDPSAV